MKWRIGDVSISKIVELEVAGKATWILPDLTAENLATVPWCKPHFATDDGQVVMSIHALLIESQGQRIIVDTCVGNDKNLTIPNWNKRQGPFLADIAAAGFPASSIDTVLCTHLHVDHVGWNTKLENGKWVPTFENARYLWNRAEYEHWSKNEQSGYGAVVQESVLPVFEAGRVDLVTPDHVVTNEVRLEPTHGHTPGHVSVHITSRGEEAVITGDLMHHPAQCAHPEWRSSADSDGAQAEQTRREFLARYADRPVLVIGTHFATPTAGKIVRDGGAYRFAV
ncbi:MAG TPA: MBL fold metallo-hydrolase [Myxococcota bacterium]|jgi:glyoxylase-like metal-dependent hydrolase (beta-lactamase superfamily II)